MRARLFCKHLERCAQFALLRYKEKMQEYKTMAKKYREAIDDNILLGREIEFSVRTICFLRDQLDAVSRDR